VPNKIVKGPVGRDPLPSLVNGDNNLKTEYTKTAASLWTDTFFSKPALSYNPTCYSPLSRTSVKKKVDVDSVSSEMEAA
jgi:hypothetical protein